MRVGVFLNDEGPEAGGGFTFDEEVRDALGRHAAESSHELVVFSRRDDAGAGARDGALAHVSLAGRGGRRPRPGKAARLARAVARRAGLRPAAARSWLYDLLEEHGIELVLALNPFFALPDVPFATIVWDLQHRLQPFFPEVSAGGEYRRRERHYRALLPRAAIVVAGTEAGKAEIERFYQVPAERIVVAPHPTPRFALEAEPSDVEPVRQRHRIAEPYLFYPAQLWPHKNHVGLLRALRRLQDEHGLSLSAVFTGADHGNLGHVRAEIERLGLGDAVRLLGFVSRQELVALYRGALALVYPSFFGPENLPPLEAFALGCPVVAADVPGAAEQLGDAALRVDPRRPEAIAAAVARLAGDPELRRTLIERGRARARRTTGSEFVHALFQAFDDFAPVRACWGTGAWGGAR